MKKKLSESPAVPAEYALADATAIQAMASGVADADQQVRALKWIVEQAAGAYEFHYYGSERDTAFALGKAFVGQQVAKMTRLNLSTLRRDSNG